MRCMATDRQQRKPTLTQNGIHMYPVAELSIEQLGTIIRGENTQDRSAISRYLSHQFLSQVVQYSAKLLYICAFPRCSYQVVEYIKRKRRVSLERFREFGAIFDLLALSSNKWRRCLRVVVALQPCGSAYVPPTAPHRQIVLLTSLPNCCCNWCRWWLALVAVCACLLPSPCRGASSPFRAPSPGALLMPFRCFSFRWLPCK
jgi:hypothetical protein